jgi:serine/threonine-protein kinase
VCPVLRLIAVIVSLFKRLIIDIHRRSIWQVLAIYLLGAAAAYQVIQSLTEGLELPHWFPGFAVVLFIVLLPVVLATAVVRERPLDETIDLADPEGARGEVAVGRSRTRSGRRLLAGALFGVVVVFAAWGAIAAGWLLLGGSVSLAGDTELPSIDAKIVVLPFKNLGPEEQEYFADGITEEITSRLTELPGLGVISRTSAATYKNTEKPVRTIADELDVDYILEGTVRWDRTADGAARVRVTPQLIRVSDDTNLWTQRYDAVLSDIFSVQSDIAEEVARALDITLLEPQRRAIEAAPTRNLEAYDAYLRGNDHYSRRFNEHDTRVAVEMYERAVELDPGFAVAWSALSRARVWLAHQFARTSVLPAARAAVEEALRLAPDLTEAHMALGDYHYYGRRDYERALEEYLAVQRQQPGNSDAIALIAWIQRRQGDFDRSIANAERAIELDPRNSVWVVGQAQNYLYTRRYREGEPFFLRAIALAPDVAYYYRWAATFYLAWDGSTARANSVLQEAATYVNPGELFIGSEVASIVLDVFGEDYAWALDELTLDEPGIDTAYYFLAKAELSLRRGQTESARALFESARVLLEERISAGPGQFAPHSALGIAYAGLGRTEEAIRAGLRGVELLPVTTDAMTGPDRVRELARVYVMCGEHEAAIEQLDYLLSIPSEISAATLRVDPFWDPLRAYPRFQMLLESENPNREGVRARRSALRGRSSTVSPSASRIRSSAVSSPPG